MEPQISQQVFNIVVTVAGFGVVYMINTITQRIQKMEDKLDDVPKDYVSKSDYKDDMREIKDLLRQIFDKLDAKVDKP